MDDRERRKSLVDRANDAYSAYQNARSLARLGRGTLSAARAAAGAARGVAGLAATSEIWGPIAIALILILIPTFLIVMGGEGAASQTPGGPTPTAGSSETSIDTKFYCQYDSRWRSAACEMGVYGCVPTALATILTSFGDTQWTPVSVSTANGGIGCKNPTDMTEIRNSLSWVRSLGYDVTDESFALQTNFKMERARQYIEDGYLLLGVANVRFITSSPTNSGGHAFVITSIDVDSNMLTVLDPTYCKSDNDFVLRYLSVDDVFCPDQANCGWYTVKGIKKL